MREDARRKLLMRRIAAVALFLLAGVLAAPSVAALPPLQPPFPEGEFAYEYETGYYIEGPFLDFYRTRGAQRIFGYPQTRRCYDPQLGLWVQYFDNVRMEWHPENPDPYKVQLGLLGEALGHRYPAIPSAQIPSGNPLRRYFPETGHVVSYAFLLFYDEAGGLDIFGYPISEPLVENGRIVQYFQRTRMEWHPERPQNERVILGQLGSAYIQRYGVPAECRERQRPDGTMGPVGGAAASQAIHVGAFVRNVITGRVGNQTVYVYVTDGARQPVSGVMATVAVRYPSEMVVYLAGPTDGRGIASISFPINSPPPGQKVVVDVIVQIGDKQKTAQTFFVPWY